MKTNKTILGLALTVVLSALAAHTTFAQPSSISVTNTVPPTALTNLLWDFTLLTNPLQNVDIKIHKVKNGQTNTEVEITYFGPCAQDGHGKLSGSGSTTATIGTKDDQGNITNVDFDNPGPYSSKGSVTSAKGVSHLAFTTHVSGNAQLQGADRSISASVSYVVKFDAVQGQISGRQVAHASASGLGSISETRTFSDTFANTDIPSQLGDGGWTLVLTFDPANGDKLSGSASVTLDSGTVYNFAFTGVFSTRTQQSKLVLKGQDSAAGSILQVMLDGSNTVTRMVGRVSGQLVNFKQ